MPQIANAANKTFRLFTCKVPPEIHSLVSKSSMLQTRCSDYLPVNKKSIHLFLNPDMLEGEKSPKCRFDWRVNMEKVELKINQNQNILIAVIIKS